MIPKKKTFNACHGFLLNRKGWEVTVADKRRDGMLDVKFRDGKMAAVFRSELDERSVEFVKGPKVTVL